MRVQTSRMIKGTESDVSCYKTQLIATKYKVDKKTNFQICRLTKEQRENNVPLCLDSNIPGKIGYELIPFPIDKILSLTASERGTLDLVGWSVGVSRSTVPKWVKKKASQSYFIHKKISYGRK